ncbi:MAG TPA: N-carbamoyl-D-amino-acid hydrolase [Geminicoccaceae bacterium]
MDRHLKVAAAQLGPIHKADDRESVVRRLMALLREAHAAGAQLVVFPELALTTFFPRYWYNDIAEIDAWFERAMPNAATRPLFDLAAELNVGFYLGYAELAEEGGAAQRYNTSVLVGPDGDIIGKYRKVHLPGHADHRPGIPFQHLEKRYFEVGNLGFPVWRACGSVVGMMICNDRRWPEAYRVMGLQGAELVLLGYNTPTYNIYHPEPWHLRMFHHRLVVQSGAYQNGCWVVASAKAGEEDGHGLTGGSCIVAPTGEIMAQALSEDDEVIIFDCDLDLCHHYKSTVFAFEEHRRIEHYGLITTQTGVVPPPLD